ncbi:MAG TPA: RsmE family RNA methyltransferase, partial [Ferruginibacter sp.]|nr:RsmE family RNA methyltransferase [Ferruginibacter sp.]
DTSKHIVQVLRMQNGEQLQLTDGKGNLFTGVITDNNRKRCAVGILQTTNLQPQTRKISIAISLLKNTSRFEWFLEKATEIGVSEIIPLVCARTEKTAFKYDRMKSILVSAMLQSQQCWLPRLHEPAKFSELVPAALQQQKLIAHCEETGEKKQLSTLQPFSASTIILIGPEGDFTPEEVQLALENNFSAVALGNTRLRTETAGVVAASLLCLV